MKPLIWAHRGASAYAPENTMPAFMLADQMHAHAVELDVHLSRDGEVVVAHDEAVDRVSDGVGLIVENTLAELKKLSFNRTHPEVKASLPTLEEVLSFLRGTQMSVNIELKTNVFLYEGIEEKTIALVERCGMKSRTIYSSFNHYTLMRLRQVEPSARIGLLYECGLVDPWKYANQLGANAIHPHFLALRAPGVVAACEAHGVSVHPWTVDDGDRMRELAQLGVHAIITNKPDLAVEVLA